MKKRIALTALVILWMSAIFWFSAQPADESGDMSLSVGRMIGKMFVPGYADLPEQEQEALAEKIDYPVRKTAHATEYAVLGILLMAALGSYSISDKGRIWISLLSGAAYAASDEFHQLFVQGRSCQISDVLLDSAGVLAGVLIYGGIAVWILKKANRNLKKME